VTARILIVGGYGVVGRYLAEQLAGFPVTVAGRSLDKAQRFAQTLEHVQARYLDVQDRASLHKALADVQLVVSCAPMDEPTLLRAAIARGCDYLDISERTAFLERACVMYEDALEAGVTAVIGMGLMPDIVNVMARAAVERLGGAERHDVRISMDGKGRWIDNVFIERFWRSLKYEEVYLYAYSDLNEARAGLERYICYYNGARRHSRLGKNTPEAVYRESMGNPALPGLLIPAGALTPRPCS